jgi:C-terminal processing protease CtpA/Prc
MQKDSTGHVGFRYKNGKITDLVKDSSAARNGLLTDHYVCEINGQNVVGMKVIFRTIKIQLSSIRSDKFAKIIESF